MPGLKRLKVSASWRHKQERPPLFKVFMGWAENHTSHCFMGFMVLCSFTCIRWKWDQKVVKCLWAHTGNIRHHLKIIWKTFQWKQCCSPEYTTSAPLPLLTSEPTSTAGHVTNSTVTEVILSTEKITTNAQQHETTTAHSAVPPTSASASMPPSTSPQTSIRTEETHTSQTPGTTADNQTSNETVSHRTTLTPASQTTNVTGVMINTTTTGQTTVIH